MNASHLGGIWKRGGAGRAGLPSPATVEEDWGWVGDGAELFLRGAPACCRVFTWDALALLVRGYARPRGSGGPVDLERLAEELRCHYLEHGTLAVDDLDGSFSLALLDGQAGRVVLYRNLVGAGCTYYWSGHEGLLFGGNLADLQAAVPGREPRPNREALPAFFLYRCVPGRETLFADLYRLLPGEQVTWEGGKVRRVQRHTFADLAGSVVIRPGEEVEQLEHTMQGALADAVSLRPGAANLLSGGVDSSYLQAVLHRVTPGSALTPSFSVAVDHPSTWLDTDYALSASRALGSRHVLVGADGPYAGYLLDLLSSTAEPPNHVQSAYFGELARDMAARGVSAGVCGEGADSLFGVGLANQVHNARVVRSLLPLAPLRGLAAGLSGLLGWDRLAYTCRLASCLDDFTNLEHPVNRVASFADVPAVEACFGRAGVSAGAAARRELLGLFQVPAEAMDQLHGAGFLGEAVDSAGLWVTLFNRAGADLLCPFLDSRMVRFALSLPPAQRYPFRRPKELLKRALSRHLPEGMARRRKLGFGQPIFEWLAEGGQLRPLVEQISEHEFVDPDTLARVKQRPSWFLYSLLCYDLWHKLFIERSLEGLPVPRGQGQTHAALR